MKNWKTFKFWLKWRNYVKSGHTGREKPQKLIMTMMMIYLNVVVQIQFLLLLRLIERIPGKTNLRYHLNPGNLKRFVGWLTDQINRRIILCLKYYSFYVHNPISLNPSGKKELYSFSNIGQSFLNNYRVWNIFVGVHRRWFTYILTSISLLILFGTISYFIVTNTEQWNKINLIVVWWSAHFTSTYSTGPDFESQRSHQLFICKTVAKRLK